MDLRTKVVVLYLCITLMIILFIGIALPISLEDENIHVISEKSIETLNHIDFALTNYIEHSKYDVYALSLNENIETDDTSGFSNFLNNSDNCGYSSNETEQKIIKVLRDFQYTHPYVQSAYLGYENGAFIRSQQLGNITTYDPRTRPWYTLAKGNPGEVVITQPYKPITSSDIKIGISKAIVDQNGIVYGVVGTDITLINLTNYISGIKTDNEEGVIMTDRNGVILASGNSSLLFSDIQNILKDQTDNFLNTDEGFIVINDSYFIYYTSPELGWKIGEIIPFRILNEQIYESFIQILIFVVFALVLLSIITIFMINRTVISPISELTEVSRRIAETKDLDQKINTDIGDDEIATLARSLKSMVDTIRQDDLERKEMEKQVAISIKQIEDNISKLSILNDEIRNPLTVILAWAEMVEDDKTKELLLKQIYEIDSKITDLDRGWLQSEKVWKFLHRYYGIQCGEGACDVENTDKEPDENPG
ncbi:putative methyl-accepting chemotaxis sensory transducer [Methanolacinia petrolearia DSM 11571]|uniref:histidine kinase n=1 Tax=Methanolacinia petrolearia (strain DSM 11571 / OCM 486 / SEBR 4847) TaxID=679926 RepID=E1RJ46_METP4|nr:hybrid sensor histidine kinase/response regulator [Methanolacinia petrolearia]ADN36716.1 putative methyl-accepting chemotaxis sensory transducer [Methanolacinia petrolearia DSM 11571]